jgi:diguanylate cyclase (GGDEF)-like protein
MKLPDAPAFLADHHLLVMAILVCGLLIVALLGSPIALLAVAVAALVAMTWFAAGSRRRLRQTSSSAELWEARARELSKTATHDTATGMGNVRQFELDWWRCLARHQRRGEPFSVAILEIGDALRTSRPLSDAVLARLGQMLANVARAEDSACRLDRQVFGVLLSGTPEEGADRFVERARIELSSHAFNDDGYSVYVTVYGGVAEWKREMGSMVELIKVAERDLELFGAECRRQGAFFEARGG